MKRIHKFALAISLSVLSAGGVVLVGNRRIVTTAKDRVYRQVDQVPARYVAIVLGAKVWQDVPSDILEDRLATALELFNAGKVKKILVTGDHGTKGYDEVNTMRDWLVQKGVPADRIFLDHAGFRTNDSMQRAARVFDVKDAIVVTQKFHLARSIYLARHAGIDAVGIVADKHRYLGEQYNNLRETLARTSAFLEVNLLGTEPKFLGSRHPITGSAKSTWDTNPR